MSTTSSSPGLCSWTVMGCSVRLLQLLSTGVASSLVASMGTQRVGVDNWFMFFWCFCYVVTLLIIIVEYSNLRSHFSSHWYNFPINYACYAALFCFSTSIISATTYVPFLPQGPTRNHAITATAFSCIAAAAYGTEFVWTWVGHRPRRIITYVHTLHGLLKLLENFVACIIFAFISNTSLYQHQPALVWCVAVYSTCFILGTLAILLGLLYCDNWLPIRFPVSQLGLTLFSILLYISALVLWLLYQFNEELGGQSQRSSDTTCRDEFTTYVCNWDQRLAVAILTAINLLLYVADLVIASCLVSDRLHPRAPDALYLWRYYVV
ncbi:myeloid-associated differentiation marker-like [Bubalus bubalis]|uniref:myeloid-associated differentiation marker-like n=1 Tax=Bubalus bubalis TaxID=89462 RepID=UPI001E1B9D62|nr:myeloid-associated differentiation marker-like [Bubalus bubalis]